MDVAEGAEGRHYYAMALHLNSIFRAVDAQCRNVTGPDHTKLSVHCLHAQRAVTIKSTRNTDKAVRVKRDPHLPVKRISRVCAPLANRMLATAGGLHRLVAFGNRFNQFSQYRFPIRGLTGDVLDRGCRPEDLSG